MTSMPSGLMYCCLITNHSKEIETHASWLVTGVETLAMAADLADDDELETSTYYK